MTKDDILKSLFFIDNLAAHKTAELYKFYNENNIKVLFIAPYISLFNMIEYVFRYIKNIPYKSLYPSINKLRNDVREIIEGEPLKNSLEKLYRETILNYLRFIYNNKEFDLNE